MTRTHSGLEADVQAFADSEPSALLLAELRAAVAKRNRQRVAVVSEVVDAEIVGVRCNPRPPSADKVYRKSDVPRLTKLQGSLLVRFQTRQVRLSLAVATQPDAAQTVTRYPPTPSREEAALNGVPARWRAPLAARDAVSLSAAQTETRNILQVHSECL